MNAKSKLSCAIAAILSSSAAGIAQGATAADVEASSDAIQEVTVTAQRRTENMQDVPIQIQALTGETLQQLNVSTFDDFVKYLPNVTSASNGPGQGVIFMRGLATSTLATQGSSGIGSFPNVSVYLDDQSGQLPGRNLDVYAADIERIEVLEGPQGTLFGAGAQAGVLRYITNKPKLDVTEGIVNAGYAYTSGGDPSSNVDATINLPLIPDTLAIRAVIYNDTRGGYINNVPGIFARQNDRYRHLLCGYCGGQRTMPGRQTQQRLVCASRQSHGQQQRPGGQCDQSRHLSGIARRRLFENQRRLECAVGSVVPRHVVQGRLLCDAGELGRRVAARSWG